MAVLKLAGLASVASLQLDLMVRIEKLKGQGARPRRVLVDRPRPQALGQLQVLQHERRIDLQPRRFLQPVDVVHAESAATASAAAMSGVATAEMRTVRLSPRRGCANSMVATRDGLGLTIFGPRQGLTLVHDFGHAQGRIDPQFQP